jgi:hypothetical protein
MFWKCSFSLNAGEFLEFGVRRGGLCVVLESSRLPETGVDGAFSAWKRRRRATILGQCAQRGLRSEV